MPRAGFCPRRAQYQQLREEVLAPLACNPAGRARRIDALEGYRTLFDFADCGVVERRLRESKSNQVPYPENKRMIQADPGVIGMHSPGLGLLFAKHTAYDPAGDYPLGTNTAL